MIETHVQRIRAPIGICLLASSSWILDCPYLKRARNAFWRQACKAESLLACPGRLGAIASACCFVGGEREAASGRRCPRNHKLDKSAAQKIALGQMPPPPPSKNNKNWAANRARCSLQVWMRQIQMFKVSKDSGPMGPSHCLFQDPCAWCPVISAWLCSEDVSILLCQTTLRLDDHCKSVEINERDARLQTSVTRRAVRQCLVRGATALQHEGAYSATWDTSQLRMVAKHIANPQFT